MLGIGRRQTAKQIAEATGRTETSVNAQLWTWDIGVDKGANKHGRRPDLASLGPYLDALDFDLALVEKLDPDAPRTWPRLDDPPAEVKRVRTSGGKIWTRIDDHYWSTTGWESGVSWSQLLCWGPVAEVKGSGT